MDDNILEASTLTIDLNSNPIQNPNETPKPRYEQTCVGEMKSLFKDDQAGELVIQELSRLNKTVTDLLTIVHVMSKNMCEEEEEQSRKRKRQGNDDDQNLENLPLSNHTIVYPSDFSAANAMPNVVRSNISRVYVRIDPSDISLVVRDGFQWRKYGQKVTRDNPSPRAYYKCSFAPACPAKKKVQRSVDDPTLLVATYEGQHHHCHPAPADNSAASPPGVGGGGGVSSPGQPIPVQCSGSTPTTDDCSKTQRAIATTDSNEIQQILVEKMASSLTRNPGFRTALAAAITGRIFDEVISSDNTVVDDINVSNSRGFSV